MLIHLKSLFVAKRNPNNNKHDKRVEGNIELNDNENNNIYLFITYFCEQLFIDLKTKHNRLMYLFNQNASIIIFCTYT